MDALITTNDSTYLTQPLLKELDDEADTVTVYYISDIHLEHQIIRAFPNGATDKQVYDYITKLISGMLTEEIVLQKSRHIILFGGDTAADFELSKLFYTRFIEVWDEKNREDYIKYRRRILSFVQERSKIKEIIKEWEDKHKWVQDAARDLLEYSDKRVPLRIKELIKRERELDDLIYDEVGDLGWYYELEWKAPKKTIYAIIGNHELWAFDSVKKCTNAYKKLLDNLGIKFLNNSGYYIWGHWQNKTAIIGGVGFAGYNDYMNADRGFYRDTLGREEEIKHTKKWEHFYNSALKKAREENMPLIILTHNPPSDWKKRIKLDGNCVYFYGHNHKNTIDIFEDTNTYVFADNQIGYENSNVKFKKTIIFMKANPFADYEDGVHQVSVEDYRLFNRFCNIYVHGTKPIEQYIENNGKFFMIKEKGYYGFFIVNENKIRTNKGKSLTKGSFICAGGRVKKISSNASIDYLKEEFFEMVQAYITVLSPYRNAQERIARLVKSFGGEGKIHGCIIDIDFLDHIMLNPSDGKVTYYHSPMFGLVKEYDTLQELLSEQAPEYLERYLAQSELPEVKRENAFLKTEKKMSVVDIKNSPYRDSMVMNQLQRLFDARLLRAWDESLLRNIKRRIDKD